MSMKKYWLHRVSYYMEISHPLLERGILTIGYSDFNSLEFRDKLIGKNGWECLEQEMKRQWGRLPKNRYSLFHFVSDMKKGDYVLVPKWSCFDIYRIDDEFAGCISELTDKDTNGLLDWQNCKLFMEEGFLCRRECEGGCEHTDLGFFRRVTTIAKGISRSDYADQWLTSRLKTRWSTADISDLAESIERARTAFEKKQPINLYSDLVKDVGNSMLKLVRSNLNDCDFEKLVARYLESQGAAVVIPAKNERKEGDGDVVACFDELHIKIYVQVKKHAEGTITDDWSVSQIRDYVTYQKKNDDDYTPVAWVVSSADGFSMRAQEEADKNGIRLIAGRDFVEMLLRSGIKYIEGI